MRSCAAPRRARNAIRLSDAALEELDRLGRVAHLVKLGDSHGIDEPFFVDRYKPEVWALPGATLGSLAVTRELGPGCPVEGGIVIEFPGVVGWRECALWLPHGGGTLITCDALQNQVDSEGASLLGRVVTPLLGFKGGVIVPPMWRRFQKVSGLELKRAMSSFDDLVFANLVTGHGPAVVGGADLLVQDAIAHALRR